MTRRIPQHESSHSQTQTQSQSQSHSRSHSNRETEEHEIGSKATASGSLNLNIVAGLSGVFGAKKTTTKDTAPDGSERAVEDTVGSGSVKGIGKGTLDARADVEAKDYERKTRAVEEGERQSQSQSQRQGQLEQTDHLGIEG
ncbi:hypothetical protein FKW77_001379 [Venturia effusa]|uniref:Uncharacterized protein n=1 Tax=Venturia effusa TaxID=50376 RepID=A0A517LAD3_9PEZI|nr:hypothetical protein FKW77_001379 [Venturia effusa]